MPGFHFDFGQIVGSLSSGAAVVLLAKLHLQKALKDLENVVNEVNEVHKNLATIAVKLENLKKVENMLQAHEKKIAVIESFCALKNKN
jgi:ABC-type phosphate transport system auxiliary subunit